MASAGVLPDVVWANRILSNDGYVWELRSCSGPGMVEGFVFIVHDNDYFDNTGFVYDGIGPDDPGLGTR